MAVGRKKVRTAAIAPMPAIQAHSVTGEATAVSADGRRQAVRGVLRGPLVTRAAWPDPADENTRTKTARLAHGYRRVDPVRHLHERQPEKVTAAHLRACERLRDDHEISLGSSPGNGHTGGKATPGPGVGPTMRQLQALESFRRAMHSVGQPGALGNRIAIFVILQGRTLKDFAAIPANRVGAEEAKGALLAVLDRLLDHYEPRNRAAEFGKIRAAWV